MSEVIELTFKPDNGKIPAWAIHRLIDTVAKSREKWGDKLLLLTLKPKREKASDRQRKYYFKIIVEAYQAHFRQQGKILTKEQMHNSLMRNIGGFSNPFVDPFTGEPDDGRMSYNDLTTVQAEGYHTLCRQWAAENGFDILGPNEVPIEAYEN